MSQEKLKIALRLALEAIPPDAVTGMTYRTGKKMFGMELGGAKSISIRKVVQNALDDKEDIFDGATVEILKGPDKNE